MPLWNMNLPEPSQVESAAAECLAARLEFWRFWEIACLVGETSGRLVQGLAQVYSRAFSNTTAEDLQQLSNQVVRRIEFMKITTLVSLLLADASHTHIHI